MNELLSLYQLAVRTRLPQRWLRQEALAGRIPCLRVGRRLRFSLAAVEETLAGRAASERAGPSVLASPGTETAKDPQTEVLQPQPDGRDRAGADEQRNLDSTDRQESHQ